MCSLPSCYNPAIDSYSAFFENARYTATGLNGYFGDKSVSRCFFVGLAYDFCVAYSALDAVRDGFEAIIVKRLTRAIALPDDGGSGTTTVDVAEGNFRDANVSVVSNEAPGCASMTSCPQVPAFANRSETRRGGQGGDRSCSIGG